MQKTIFVVDDNDTNLSMAKEALKDQYRVMTLPSAAKMFALIEKVAPDLILLDIEMPDVDGFQALRQLKSDTTLADVPVIFLTSMTDASVEASGFELGVVDFIAKPFSIPVLQNRIKTHLDIDGLIRERTAKLQQQTEQLQRLQNSIVSVLADMVENRDKGTGGHIERTSAYIRILIDAMLAKGVYPGDLLNIDVESFVSSARLHDVGKIVISDIILNKPGKLTEDEFETMKTHTTEGEQVVSEIVSRAESDEVFLHHAKLFTGYHHERWDGAGYPHGLGGTAIPIQGRLMALVDVYDALVSERPYKLPITHKEAVEIIMEGAGKHFDPYIAQVFYEVKDEFEAVKAALEM